MSVDSLFSLLVQIGQQTKKSHTLTCGTLKNGLVDNYKLALITFKAPPALNQLIC